jgi:tRNA dimethylallyltransferase
MSSARERIIIITGPTAVGKSKLGVALARRLDGEVISADSVQVYSRLDVGSDKITVEDRQGVPHHLIDILEPTAEFSAGDFYHAARAAASDALSRGKLPILVGGTGFYLRWFIFGKASTPASNPETAEKVDQMIQQVGGGGGGGDACRLDALPAGPGWRRAARALGLMVGPRGAGGGGARAGLVPVGGRSWRAA